MMLNASRNLGRRNSASGFRNKASFDILTQSIHSRFPAPQKSKKKEHEVGIDLMTQDSSFSCTSHCTTTTLMRDLGGLCLLIIAALKQAKVMAAPCDLTIRDTREMMMTLLAQNFLSYLRTPK